MDNLEYEAAQIDQARWDGERLHPAAMLLLFTAFALLVVAVGWAYVEIGGYLGWGR